ncbi:MAG: hypothetical protein KJ893_05360 [Candidatus Omnitrophica bacterium]|nr:hypothetical protein [Candidatus Omnitrophota bacterium]MBU4479523.1 hypothetical protein [Candidatus Omnitrophota bacterium]
MKENIYLPSSLKNFEKIVIGSLRLLSDIDESNVYSAYSLIPLISQILGVNTPLMGTGDSPYSLVSAVFQMRKKQSLFDGLFKISLEERRKVIDEMYEMVAPCLLEEEGEYIELLLNTKYKYLLKNNKKNLIKEKKVLEDKFSLLAPVVEKNRSSQGDFAHMIHYGYPADLYREFSFLEKMPKALVKQWRDYSYPVVNEFIIRNFPVKNKKAKTAIKGWVLFVTNHTRELLESGSLRKRKILQAAKLARRMGARIVGMGGLIASFAQGGHWLSEQIPDMGFTTGHAYTIGNIMEILDNAAGRVNLDIRKATVAIVGAAGSIGSGCAKLLADRKPGRIILIDLNTFDALRKLEEVKNYIKNVCPDINVLLSINLRKLKKADVVIVATNSVASIIKKEHLKQGAIVIDDSFPKNVSERILRERKDIILLEGGMTRLPSSIEVLAARNMPDLMDIPLTRLVSCKETYSCVAETLTLGLYGYKKNYGLGQSDPALAKDIMTKARQRGFNSAPLQCFDEAVEEERFECVRKLVKQ